MADTTVLYDHDQVSATSGEDQYELASESSLDGLSIRILALSLLGVTGVAPSMNLTPTSGIRDSFSEASVTTSTFEQTVFDSQISFDKERLELLEDFVRKLAANQVDMTADESSLVFDNIESLF